MRRPSPSADSKDTVVILEVYRSFIFPLYKVNPNPHPAKYIASFSMKKSKHGHFQTI